MFQNLPIFPNLGVYIVLDAHLPPTGRLAATLGAPLSLGFGYSWVHLLV